MSTKSAYAVSFPTGWFFRNKEVSRYLSDLISDYDERPPGEDWCPPGNIVWLAQSELTYFRMRLPTEATLVKVTKSV